MQQLLVKLKNTPTDASQVCSSVNYQLNRDQNLSVGSKVLANNNLDVNQPAKAEPLQVKSEILWLECNPYILFNINEKNKIK